MMLDEWEVDFVCERHDMNIGKRSVNTISNTLNIDGNYKQH